MIDHDEKETPYVKSKARSVAKTDHKHEYIKPFKWSRIMRFDGSISEESHKFTLSARCIDCGHINRKAFKDAIPVEVSQKEYARLSKK